MNQENKNETKSKLPKWLINKYVIALSLFAVVYLFVGNQSLINRIKYAYEIREKKSELREYKEKIYKTRNDIEALQDPAALERYAREHYYMRADNEDVYIIKE